jgi:hypothetical protein
MHTVCSAPSNNMFIVSPIIDFYENVFISIIPEKIENKNELVFIKELFS